MQFLTRESSFRCGIVAVAVRKSCSLGSNALALPNRTEKWSQNMSAALLCPQKTEAKVKDSFGWFSMETHSAHRKRLKITNPKGILLPILKKQPMMSY